ncbi:MAG TPA: hypothetical protein VEB65_02515 [Solirubrobacterales bacterium]|nr:hypothetical protein [Solirubrobacterales bacterium]
MSRRLIAVVTDTLQGDEPARELAGSANGEGIEVRLVVPAVEANVLRHTMGDIDEPREQARSRLEASLRYLQQHGVEARGEVGDPDPVQAAQDALLKEPADEVVFFEYKEGQERWFEDGLFEHAKESLEPPLRMVVLDGQSEDRVVDVEKAGRGTIDGVEHEVGSAYLPGLSRNDLAGMIAGIVGTVVVAILAAVAAGGSGTDTGWAGVAIGVGIFTALINFAHVVGLTLMETVRYRGGFAKFFRTLSLVGTPIAILVNLAIVLFA